VNPNGDKRNVGEGYVTNSDKTILYGEGLRTKIWDPQADVGEANKGNYVDYDPAVHGDTDIREASETGQVRGNALANADVSILQGSYLDALKSSDAFRSFEFNTVKAIKSDPRWGSGQPYSVAVPSELLTFGGPQTTAAFDNLTWVVRHAYVNVRAEITKDNIMGVTYYLEDKLDLETGTDKSRSYNAVVWCIGPLWPGNENMKVNAAWRREYVPK
jgi:hypothetical protein